MPPTSIDAGADDERLHAFRQAFADHVEFPTSASVIDAPVTVVEVAYDGNTRRGLTARCRTGQGSEHMVALADVRFPEGSEAARLVAGNRAWLGLETAPDAPTPLSHGRARPAGADGDIDLSRPVELVVLAVKERAARCRLLGTDSTITLRSSGLWDAVPGEIITVRPRKHWRYAGHPYLSGDVADMRLDVAALGLAPLRLEPYGTWDPAEEYWGEEGDAIDDWARSIIAHGPRPEFEIEQVLPGSDPNDPDVDPIIESNELRDAGDLAGARRILMALLVTSSRAVGRPGPCRGSRFSRGSRRRPQLVEGAPELGEPRIDHVENASGNAFGLVPCRLRRGGSTAEDLRDDLGRATPR